MISTYTSLFPVFSTQKRWICVVTLCLVWLGLQTCVLADDTSNRPHWPVDQTASSGWNTSKHWFRSIQGHIRIRGQSESGIGFTYSGSLPRGAGYYPLPVHPHSDAKQSLEQGAFQPISGYHQLYATHCYQRMPTATDYPLPLLTR